MVDMPVDNVVWVDVEKLKANDYNPNVVLTKEMNLLKLSILKNGWIQPILITMDYEIIDGFHRCSLIKLDKKVYDLTKGKVPCVKMDLTESERMLLTIRINRAKGNHIAYKMSDVVHRLFYEYGVDVKTICKEIGANKDEVDLLLEDNVFTWMNINDESKYSKAWVPERGKK